MRSILYYLAQLTTGERPVLEVLSWVAGVASAVVYLASLVVGWFRSRKQLPAARTSEPAPSGARLKWPKADATFKIDFPGREREIRHFWKVVTNQDGHRILMLKGDTNVGKSTLRRELASTARDDHGLKVAEVECRNEQAKVDAMIDRLATTLKNQAIALDDYWSAKGNESSAYAAGDDYSQDHTRNQFLAGLVQNKCPIVLFVDIFEKATPIAQHWICTALLPTVLEHPGLCVVLLGQTIPSESEHPWEEKTRRFELGPIRELDTWKSYLARHPDKYCGVESGELQKILNRTRGIPGEVFLALAKPKFRKKKSVAAMGTA